MPTNYLGSFIINSGRLSLSAGVSFRGWKPGLSLFMNSPIVSNLACRQGLWWVLQSKQKSQVADHYALVNSDESHDLSCAPFSWHRKIITFQTWGKLKVDDTVEPNTKATSCKFPVHPGKYQLISCVKQLEQKNENGQYINVNSPFTDDITLFLIRPIQMDKISKDEVRTIQKDVWNWRFETPHK
jgi:hypothetical protein